MELAHRTRGTRLGGLRQSRVRVRQRPARLLSHSRRGDGWTIIVIIEGDARRDSEDGKCAGTKNRVGFHSVVFSHESAGPRVSKGSNATSIFLLMPASGDGLIPHAGLDTHKGGVECGDMTTASSSMRPIWKGAISFGLVNIPITLYPATRREELRFHFLRKRDLSPINNKRVAEADGKEVPWNHIVRGYEFEKGKFVVLNEDDFSRVDVEATQTVDIQEFVELDEINPMMFSKPYYMEPVKSGAKAYALLREVLRGTKKVGIAKVVIKTREHLAAVKAQGDALVLELMHFVDEIIPAEELHVPGKTKIGKKEEDMAKDLVESMSDTWDPKKYQDDYKEALLDVIQKKVAAGGKKVPKAKKAKGAKPTNVIDLVAVLQKSIQQHGHSRSKKTTHAKAQPKTHTKTRRKAA